MKDAHQWKMTKKKHAQIGKRILSKKYELHFEEFIFRTIIYFLILQERQKREVRKKQTEQRSS